MKDDYSDVVTLHIDQKQIKAHRHILSAKSPVFKELFEIGMSESDIDVDININDFSYECTKALLKFIYTGSCNYIGR